MTTCQGSTTSVSSVSEDAKRKTATTKPYRTHSPSIDIKYAGSPDASDLQSCPIGHESGGT